MSEGRVNTVPSPPSVDVDWIWTPPSFPTRRSVFLGKPSTVEVVYTGFEKDHRRVYKRRGQWSRPGRVRREDGIKTSTGTGSRI